MDSHLSVFTTLNEMIAASDKTINVLTKLKTSADPEFDLVCIDNRLKSLIPVIECTETMIRKENLTFDKLKLRLVTELERSACTLWNTIAMVMKPEKLVSRERYCRAKLFASMLQSLCESTKPDPQTTFKIFSCYISTFNSCIDENEGEIGQTCHQYLLGFFTYMESCKESLNMPSIKRLEQAKYKLYLANIQHCVQSGDLVAAKFYESNLPLISREETTDLSKNIEVARVLMNSGITVFERENFTEAHYFFQKCCSVTEKILRTPGSDVTIPGIAKIHYSSLKLLIECSLKQESYLSNEEAGNLANMLLREFPWKVEPYKLLADLLYRKKVSQSLYNEVLMNMVMSVDFKLNGEDILGALNSFAENDTDVVKRCLSYLMQNKIDFEKDKQDLCEKCAISLFWTITRTLSQEYASEEQLKETDELLSLCKRRFISPLSKESLNSFMTLIWKSSTIFIRAKKFKIALKWMDLYSHDLFKYSSVKFIEAGKILRQKMRVYLELGLNNEIVQVYQEMEEVDKGNPYTQYYMFCSHLFQNASSEATLQYLEAIQRAEPKSLKFNLLSLCTAEAHSHNNTPVFAAAAILLARNCRNDRGLDGVSADGAVYVALKAFIYTTMQNIDNWKTSLDAKTIYDVFQEATELIIFQSSHDKTLNSVNVSINDLEWFASKAYTAGTKCLEDSVLEESVKFFDLARKVIDISLKENDTAHNMKLWKARCLTLKTRIQVSLLSLEPKETDGSNWTDILRDCEIHWGLCQESQSSGKKWSECYIESFSVYAEALWENEEYNRLIKVVKEEVNCNFESIFDITATLLSTLPGGLESKRTIFKYILEESFSRGTSLPTKYLIRQVKEALSVLAPTFDYDTCFCYLELLSTKMKLDLEEKGNIEVDWIAITCWNRAVDEFKSKHNDPGKRWYDYSLKFCNYCADKSLKDQIESSYQSLSEICQIISTTPS